MLKVLTLLWSLAFASPDSLKMYDTNKYVDVAIQQYGKFRLTKTCFTSGKPKCEAYQSIAKTTTARSPQAQYSGHPAVRHCHEKGGIDRILIEKDGSQYDYCRFNDGSMIDAWDLYDASNK